MAGSLNHIVNGDGTFEMKHIENLGDASEALSECHQVIAALVAGRPEELERLCLAMAFPVPATPIIQPILWGAPSNRQGRLRPNQDEGE